jgi:hypothetical protein
MLVKHYLLVSKWLGKKYDDPTTQSMNLDYAAERTDAKTNDS